jgi:hypothetical protein
MTTSVASVWSVRDRSASPITRLYRPIDATTLARRLEPLDFCHPTGPRSAMVRMIPKLATVPLRHSGTGCLHPPSPTEGMAEFLGFPVVLRSTLPDTPELATVPDDIGANVDGPGLTLSAPDHSTVSRRAVTLPVIQPAQVPHGPLHVLIDSTGLQVYGAGQWLEARHGAKSRRTWRKLHLAVDAAGGMIVAQTLTDQDVDDPSRVGSLLDQIDDPTGKVTADGAYDGTPTYQTIAQHGDGIEVVIPPRATAVPGGTECQLDDRNGRGGKSHDDRRVDARGGSAARTGLVAAVTWESARSMLTSGWK